ncbi:hypothetical protein FE633_17520 [Streptomyces montanus]|uniref:Uncharacterized protein n=1 Tax=Streptomyces montanus TaxID=2580423 RepID=A0A5R9FM22_9ACTN|nr:hypothetical protein [Streptomyces montanus]TLS44942.1 hypothetical protein FE633_17520 [Streptomyces montanus]
MTQRHAGYVVALDENLREDDAEQLINAIKMLRGVIAVQPVTADVSLSLATERVRHEYRHKVLGLLRELG